jgi:hypothetical protein
MSILTGVLEQRDRANDENKRKVEFKRKRISFGHVEYIHFGHAEEDDADNEQSATTTTTNKFQLFNFNLNLK